MYSLLGIMVFILSIFGGINIWAKSDLPMIQREIAKNTRKDEDDGPEYNAVKVISVVNKIGSILVIIFGIIAMVVLIIFGQIYGNSIQGIKL